MREKKQPTTPPENSEPPIHVAQRMERRQFVKATAAGGLAASTLTTKDSQAANEDAPVTLAIMGLKRGAALAKRFAKHGQFSAVICLGAVIRGETTHDQYINQQVSQTLGAMAIEHELPVLFGLLTCQTLDQAINRSGGSVGNKGADCALAALEMIDLMNQVTS